MVTQPQSTYRRLPGRSEWTLHLVRTEVSSRLWLAEDHILNIRTTRYSSSYRRYYLADIQALSMTKTTRRAIVNVVLGLLTMLVAMLAHALTLRLGAQGTLVSLAISLLCASPLLILMLINTLRGPACVCYVYTAVQRDELPSLARVKTAERVFPILRSLIDDAQGTPASDWLEAEANSEVMPATPHSASPRT